MDNINGNIVTLVKIKDGKVTKDEVEKSKLSTQAIEKMKTLTPCWWHDKSLPDPSEKDFIGFYDKKKYCWDNCHERSVASFNLYESLKSTSENVVKNKIESIQRSAKIIGSYFKQREFVKDIKKKYKKQMIRYKKVSGWNDKSARESEMKKCVDTMAKLKVQINDASSKLDSKKVVQDIYSVIKLDPSENDDVNHEIMLFQRELTRFINSITKVEYDSLMKEMEPKKSYVSTGRRAKKYIDSSGKIIIA